MFVPASIIIRNVLYTDYIFPCLLILYFYSDLLVYMQLMFFQTSAFIVSANYRIYDYLFKAMI